MITQILTSIRAMVGFTILCGILYPLGMTGIARTIFPRPSAGSIVATDGREVGSSLLAQKFEGARYFHPRPSAADYGTVASGASNQGFTSRKLVDAVNERRSTLGESAPPDMLYASGSGLDPDISPEAARFQAARVAAARGVSEDIVQKLIYEHTKAPQFGFFGQSRVNVLLLNLALDQKVR